MSKSDCARTVLMLSKIKSNAGATILERHYSIWLSILLLASGPAAAHVYDPQGSSVFVSAVNWLQGTLLGTVATVAAVIAVASVGFMMLTGRINWRHGAVVILGCFVLFGAASIVAGIQSAAAQGM